MQDHSQIKRGLYVKVNNNNINQAITILKRKMNEEGIKKELRAREHFVSKSQKRRKDRAAGIRRHQKNRAMETE